MARARDPGEPIRKKAATYPDVIHGTACNQDSFKVGRGSFLFVGPGAKGKGCKAMFKLDRSMPRARKLAAEDPDRFQVGSTGWVTTRFTTENPLPKSIWEKWLRESYELTRGSGTGGGKKTAKKKTAKKKSAGKKTAKTRKAGGKSGRG